MKKTKNERINGNHSTLCKMDLLLNDRLDTYDKCVYLYMRFRHQFFHAKGLPYKESNSTIAKELNISLRKVLMCINKLESEGLVIREVCKHIIHNKVTGKTNNYIVVDNLARNCSEAEETSPF